MIKRVHWREREEINEKKIPIRRIKNQYERPSPRFKREGADNWGGRGWE